MRCKILPQQSLQQQMQGWRQTLHLGAGDAHGDADVGEFQGGRIVHAIASHCHHIAHLPQQPHNVLVITCAQSATAHQQPGLSPDLQSH